MSIGIDIQARYQQIKEAKQHVEALGSSLKNVQGLADLGDFGFDPSQSERMKEMITQVNRLNTIAGQGERKGGFLDPKQFTEANRLMQQLTRGVQDYGKEIDKLKQKHSDLMRQEMDLTAKLRSGQGTSDDRSRRNQIRGESARVGDEIDRLQRDEDRVQRIRQDAMHASNTIGGMDASGQGSNIGSILKKTLGWGLAAAGGFSLLGFLSQSRAKYQQSVGHEATLYGRGISGGFGDNVGLGFGPLDQMALLEQISGQAGMGGGRARKAANMSVLYGRYAGIDPNQVGSLYGTMYGSTGNANMATGAVSLMGDAIRRGMDKAKSTELLMMVTRNTQTTAQAMGGAGASGSQVGGATMLAIEAIKAQQGGASYGQFAKSQEFYNVMQNGLKGAGTGAGDVMLFKAMGGFNGPMTWEKIHELNMMKQGGFLQRPDLLQNIVGGLSGSAGSRAGQLETMFKSWGIDGKGAEQIIKMSDSGFLGRISKAMSGGKRIEDLANGSASDKELYNQWKSSIAFNPAMGKLALEAQREQEHLKTGEKLNEAFGKLEASALKAADALLNTSAVNSAVAAAQAAGNWTNNNPNSAAWGLGTATVAGGGWLAKRKFFPKIPSGGGTASLASEFGVGTRSAGFASELAGMGAKSGIIGKLAPWAMIAGLPFEMKADWNRHASRHRERKYVSIIAEAAKQYGLDPILLMSMVKQESGFNPDAVSPKGAVGLGQIMPSNFKSLGLTAATARDPNMNVMAMARLLSDLQSRHPGSSTAKLLAMYNWGEGNYSKKGGFNNLPQETRGYIANIDKNYHDYTGGMLGGKGLIEWEPKQSRPQENSGEQIANVLLSPLTAMLQYLHQIAENTKSAPIKQPLPVGN